MIKTFQYIIHLLKLDGFKANPYWRGLKVRKIQSRKASPVIATVILVAVAITVSVAVAYWMGGISSQYTQFEKVDIQTAICTLDPGTGNWQIEVKLKNSGSKASTLTNVFINDVEVSLYQVAPVIAVDTIMTDMTIDPPYSIESGNSGTVKVWIGEDYLFLSSGPTVNIKLHIAGGMDYIKLVQLV